MTSYLAGIEPPTQAQWGGIGWLALIAMCCMFLAMGLRR